mmetsp:Transcript_20765/g.26817  ORF Transcript_20765/g.26817 Transcript_20765/m.26817 type:complete len:314 (+) Transcript_20765:55-996(+)
MKQINLFVAITSIIAFACSFQTASAFITPSSISLTLSVSSSSVYYTTRNALAPLNAKPKSENTALLEFDSDLVNDFCQGTNTFWKGLVIEPVRNYVEIQPAGTSKSDAFSKLIAPPELPGMPRPVWLTMLGSIPTALGWYGYYKFSIEEELYQYELKEEGKVTGCGGYGTLFPFVFGILIGFPLQVLHLGGDKIIDAAAFWILAGQVNLYRRVNELCEEEKDALSLSEPPLHAWWALLPPPLDVVVGLRQVHFLSEFWRIKRDDVYDKDIIAEELFPFISSERFTLKQFFRTPSRWFWFTKDWKDFDYKFLKD